MKNCGCHGWLGRRGRETWDFVEDGVGGGKLAEGCSLVVHLCRATSIHALWVNAMWSFYSFKIVGCLNNEG